jgi:hypothetical protein
MRSFGWIQTSGPTICGVGPILVNGDGQDGHYGHLGGNSSMGCQYGRQNLPPTSPLLQLIGKLNTAATAIATTTAARLNGRTLTNKDGFLFHSKIPGRLRRATCYCGPSDVGVFLSPNGEVVDIDPEIVMRHLDEVDYRVFVIDEPAHVEFELNI